jgi:hypothetical protein
MKTALEIPDRTLRKAEAAAGALKKNSQRALSAREDLGRNVRANWPIYTKKQCGHRRLLTRNSNRSNLRSGLDSRHQRAFSLS